MKAFQLGDPEAFFEAARDSGRKIRAIRTYTVVYSEEVGREVSAIRHYYEVPVDTDAGQVRYTYTEVIPVEEPSGILRTAGSLWRRIRDANLPMWLDMLRSGAL